MAEPGSKIDVCSLRSGRLALIADGTSVDATVAVRLSGDVLEISDCNGVVARAVGAGSEVAGLLAWGRDPAVVLIDEDGSERLHGARIRMGG